MKGREENRLSKNTLLDNHFLHDAFSALLVGHTPNTAGTFRRKFRKNSGKTPETLSELFLGVSLKSTARIPQALHFKAFEASRAFPEFSVRLGTPLFSEVIPERASQSWSWNSQQYSGNFLPVTLSEQKRLAFQEENTKELGLATRIGKTQTSTKGHNAMPFETQFGP